MLEPNGDPAPLGKLWSVARKLQMATGVKACVGLGWAYFAVFLPSAKAVTAPASLVALDE